MNYYKNHLSCDEPFEILTKDGIGEEVKHRPCGRLIRLPNPMFFLDGETMEGKSTSAGFISQPASCL